MAAGSISVSAKNMLDLSADEITLIKDQMNTLVGGQLLIVLREVERFVVKHGIPDNRTFFLQIEGEKDEHPFKLAEGTDRTKINSAIKGIEKIVADGSKFREVMDLADTIFPGLSKLVLRVGVNAQGITEATNRRSVKIEIGARKGVRIVAPGALYFEHSDGSDKLLAALLTAKTLKEMDVLGNEEIPFDPTFIVNPVYIKDGDSVKIGISPESMKVLAIEVAKMVPAAADQIRALDILVSDMDRCLKVVREGHRDNLRMQEHLSVQSERVFGILRDMTKTFIENAGDDFEFQEEANVIKGDGGKIFENVKKSPMLEAGRDIKKNRFYYGGTHLELGNLFENPQPGKHRNVRVKRSARATEVAVEVSGNVVPRAPHIWYGGSR